MRTLILLAIAAMAISTGCKKDKIEKPGCKISKLTTANGKDIDIFYNADGTYAKIINEEKDETIINAYRDDSIVNVISQTSTGRPIRKIAVKLNNQGMVSSRKIDHYNGAGDVTATQTKNHDYNGTELVKSTSVPVGNTPPVVETFSWTAGNLTAGYSMSNNSIFEYYSDQLFQQADGRSILDLLFAGHDNNIFIKNKNLIKYFFGIIFSYQFDAEGRVNAIYQDGSLLYNVYYDCN